MNDTINIPEQFSNPFDEIIGQESAKRKLGFYVKSYANGGIVPHVMLVAPRGCGKTTLGKAFGHSLVRNGEGKHKPVLTVNCSTIKSMKQFFTQLVLQYIHEKEVTVFFDEASELPKDVTMALLTILNPNPTNRNTFVYDEYTFDFDFARQTFIFATSESHKIFHALMDRCDRVDLEEYQPHHLCSIIQKYFPAIEWNPATLLEIASVLRGNARSAVEMCKKIGTYLTGNNRPEVGPVFDHADWKNLMWSMGILPLGLTRIELQLLRILFENKDMSLTALSAKTMMSRESLQRDVELYLQKLNLMQIDTTGRNITVGGCEYIRKIDAEAQERGLVLATT